MIIHTSEYNQVASQEIINTWFNKQFNYSLFTTQ